MNPGGHCARLGLILGDQPATHRAMGGPAGTASSAAVGNAQRIDHGGQSEAWRPGIFITRGCSLRGPWINLASAPPPIRAPLPLLDTLGEVTGAALYILGRVSAIA